MSAFNVAQLVAIHFARTERHVSVKDLAKQYNVSESTIRRAVAKVEGQQAKFKANVVSGATASIPTIVRHRSTPKKFADIKPPVAYTVGRQLAEESVSCHPDVKRPTKKWAFEGQAKGRIMRPRKQVEVRPYEQTAMFLAFAAAK